MTHTLQQIIKNVAFATGLNPSAPGLDKEVLASKIDRAQDRLTDILLEVRPELLVWYFDLPLTGLSEYRISDYTKFNYESIRLMEDVTAPDSHISTSPDTWYNHIVYSDSDLICTSEPWMIRDEYIEFPNRPSGVTMRVWYTRRPTGLFYCTATGGTTSTVTFPATATVGEIVAEDDWYNGMRVYCAGQTRRITDYTGATRTATVSPAWTVAPTSTSVVSLISPLPDRMHPIIADLAARYIKVSNDDDDSPIRRMIDDELATGRRSIARPQSQTPEYIRKVPR